MPDTETTTDGVSAQEVTLPDVLRARKDPSAIADEVVDGVLLVCIKIPTAYAERCRLLGAIGAAADAVMSQRVAAAEAIAHEIGLHVTRK